MNNFSPYCNHYLVIKKERFLNNKLFTSIMGELKSAIGTAILAHFPIAAVRAATSPENFRSALTDLETIVGTVGVGALTYAYNRFDSVKTAAKYIMQYHIPISVGYALGGQTLDSAFTDEKTLLTTGAVVAAKLLWDGPIQTIYGRMN